MPRPIWSGRSASARERAGEAALAVSPKDVRFHQIDSRSKARVKQKRVSSTTGEEVPYEEIVKGYEIAPDRYVVIEPEELEALDPKSTKTIDIEDFVDLDTIDPVYFERPYYLVPEKGGVKATPSCATRCARRTRWASPAWSCARSSTSPPSARPATPS